MRYPLYRNTVLACLAMLAFGSAAPSPALDEGIGFAPADVPKHYRFVYSPGLTKNECALAKQGVPYNEIHFSRTECFGDCPAYSVTLRRDGTATYVGKSYVPKVGEYTGEIDILRFGRLCLAIDRFKLDECSPEYAGSWTDDATALLTVKNRDNEAVIQISDYGAQGPIELWAVHQIIDALVSKIEWERSGKLPPQK